MALLCSYDHNVFLRVVSVRVRSVELRVERFVCKHGHIRRIYSTCHYPHVELEHVCGDADGHDVVDDEFAEAGQEIASLVQLLDLLVLVGVVCRHNQRMTSPLQCTQRMTPR